MTSPIVLEEYEHSVVDLPAEDVAFLQRDLGRKFALDLPLAGSGVRVNPGPFVGVVGLPSGRVIQVQPKVEVANLLYMLGVAWEQADPFLLTEAEAGSVEDVMVVIAWHFVRQVDRLVSQGLLRDYRDQEDNLSAVRGRISFIEDLRRNQVTRHRVYCRFSDLVWDIPENQVIRQVVGLLRQASFPPALHQALIELDGTLADITPGTVTGEELDRFVYHRLNQHYRPLHRLCRLLIDLLSPVERGVGTSTWSFLIDMNRLFEKYVTQQLGSLIQNPLRVRDQYWTSLDEGKTISIRPDIVILDGLTPAFIVDCKYKRLAPGQHRHGDLFQMVSYCTALDVTHGWLVYPRHLADITNVVDIRSSQLRLRETTLDLSGSIQQMQESVRQLAVDIALTIGPETQAYG